MCGCDGKTYGNKCLATVAGIRLFTPGACGGTDTCRQAPDPTMICTTVYSPVCGCDGKTYGNKCVATAAGIKETKDGACVATNPDPPVNTCRVDPNPDLTCPRTITTPVCGCDGVTYPNACLAEVVGIKQTTPGACTSNNPNTPPTDPTNDCVGAPPAILVACPTISRPVCGCDGKTYNNDCFALLAGIKRYTQGSCTSSGPR